MGHRPDGGLTTADKAADRLTKLVMARVGATKPSEVTCPRERSEMTPCIARDGHLALADDGDCVGCMASPFTLLREEEAKP